MKEKETDNKKEKNNLISEVDINKEMQEAYLQYSMSVIVGRALPDVRDGLKPVHRRILYAQNDLGNRYDKPYKKSARIVGDVIGKYHPHGDVAVYETMVRMAQDFSLRYPLIDGQGNFGSIDGDSPAAQRYTEVRMTKLSEELLEDIEKETVDFVPNYDDSLMVPVVLPAKFPNLLINGSSGIAVGMATNIPPHNLSEVIMACIEIIKNPDISIEEIIKIIPGPDFPTAGIIAGNKGINLAYKEGKGIISLKAVSEIFENKDKQEIIITEIPYQVNKAKLIENIAYLVKEKKIEGISDVRDESSREGMRIVIVVKKNENAHVILNRLYKYTQMQVSFGIILLALDVNNQPQIFSIKTMLQAFVEHRKDVVTKRCIYDLKRAQKKLHILEGVEIALKNIDKVIALIRAAKENFQAKQSLIQEFNLSEEQSQAILEMRLQRLTGLEREKLLKEIEEIKKNIEWLKKVLGSTKEIYNIIEKELIEIKEKYGDKRKTKIVKDVVDVEVEDLISEEDMIVIMTKDGYIKRIPLDQYKIQKRGGKGSKGMGTREEDVISAIFHADTLTTLLFFTDKGKVYWSKVYKLPIGSRISSGKAINNIIQLSNKEKVQAILPVKDFDASSFVILVTKKGIIKKASLELFSHPRFSGIIALTIDLNDCLISAKISNGNQDIFVATKEGMSIRFDEKKVRAVGRTAKGVKAISLSKKDDVIGMEVFGKEEDATICVVTERGFGKRTNIKEYRSQGRSGVGIITQKITEKIGKVVATSRVSNEDDLILITDKGQVIRISAKDISVLGRNTQGVRLINLNIDEKVKRFAIISEEDE